jgi:FMN reductase
MTDVVVLSASPSPTSRSTFLAREVASRLQGRGLAVASFSVFDFDAADVLTGRAKSPPVARFLESLARARAIVFATPVYKATYSGALKAVIDLIRPDALVGRRALGIATAKIAVHGREAAAAYRGLFAFFRLGPADTFVVLDDELSVETDTRGTLSADAAERFARAVERLVQSI